MPTLLQVRRGTAAAWTSANPTLQAGEPGLETDTLKFKFGDGSTAWNSLAYEGVSNATPLLTPTAVKTTNYTAAVGDFVPVDTQTTGAVTVTLPTAPADKSRIAVKNVKALLGRATTVAAGGSDVFNVASGSTSLVLPNRLQSVTLQYASSPAIWYVQASDPGAQVIGSGQLFTAGGTYTIPIGATLLEMVGVGAGGGGGGGGSQAGSALQAGGAGGGAGASAATTIAVGNNTQITVTIGAGGAGGVQAAAGGHPGSQGTQGGNTTLVGDGSGISVTAYGGSGGLGPAASSSSSVSGGAVGGASPPGNNTAASSASAAFTQAPGVGGQGVNVAGQGGPGNGYIGGGGGAGANSSLTAGGTGGGAGTSNIGGALTTTTTGTAAGGNGSSAAANTGAGGGGGGGGTNNTGAGGTGGTGGSGWATVKVVG